MLAPFGKTKALEAQIDEFLDIIVNGVLDMKRAVVAYLEGDLEEFSRRIEGIVALERRADDIRKRTETTLYTHSLIPESRGDVLGLLENMDNVIDAAKHVLQSFEVQRPQIPEEYRKPFLEVTEHSIQSVENVVAASRCYFREVHRVRDFINKVDYYESEADHAGLKLKRMIFDSDMELAHKLHLRYYAEKLETLSDIAEAVGERLAIAAIKRTI
jgi:predicted phosphate transport protein (TIGR00153 family)